MIIIRIKFNINKFIWVGIILLMAYYCFKLSYTGNLGNFIHPRMFKYTYFSILVMLLMIAYEFPSIFTKSSKSYFKFGYLLFLIVLFLGIVINPTGLTPNIADTRGEGVLSRKIFTKDKIENIAMNNTRDIEVTEDIYVTLLGDIYENVEYYKGKNISVKGFVFREDNYKKEEFVAARMMVNCCAADAEVIGFLCSYDKALELSKDEWVKVNGMIDTTVIKENNTSKKIPLIKVTSIESIEEPPNKYVYP